MKKILITRKLIKESEEKAAKTDEIGCNNRSPFIILTPFLIFAELKKSWDDCPKSIIVGFLKKPGANLAPFFPISIGKS